MKPEVKMCGLCGRPIVRGKAYREDWDIHWKCLLELGEKIKKDPLRDDLVNTYRRHYPS